MSGAPQQHEIESARRWAEESFAPEKGQYPISFVYDGTESVSVISGWKAERREEPGSPECTRRTVTVSDPRTGLECRTDLTVYADYPVVEWVGYLKNTGTSDTPIIRRIRSLESCLATVPRGLYCRLHYSLGSNVRVDDFMPMEWMLYAGGTVKLTQASGRSSSGVALPFFNLDLGDQGIIGAIGWTGSWALELRREASSGIIIGRAGMAKTNLKLHAGEEIRTPRIALLFWEGDRMHGHNMLRRFILAHHTPRPAGKPLQAPICGAVWGENRCENQIAKARWWKQHEIPITHFWIDAGWFGDLALADRPDSQASQWSSQVGTWRPNAATYPDGMRPIGDALEGMGLGFVLWVEPERALEGTDIAREHPDWLLREVGNPIALVDLGNPEARQGITDLISSTITQGRVTCYRQDFNRNPAAWWEKNDAPDRIGMHEIRHIEGLYALWDELLRRHPGLIIDNCSSGGRRIDLETISRSIPLWRSDYQCMPYFDPKGMQGQTHGLALWVPLSAGSCLRQDTYAFRSAMSPGMVLTMGGDPQEYPPEMNAAWLKRAVTDQAIVGKYFTGDFYPILSYNLNDDCWLAWQFHRPDLGEGVVLAFRRPLCRTSRIDAPLQGLEPDADYDVKSLDHGASTRLQGRELVDRGLAIHIDEKPGSALFVYRRK